MASLVTSTFLDITFGALWWVTKETTKGIYYGTKYLFFGPEEKIIEVKETDIRDLVNELEQLRSEIKEIKNKNNLDDTTDEESLNDFEEVNDISKTDLNNNE